MKGKADRTILIWELASKYGQNQGGGMT